MLFYPKLFVKELLRKWNSHTNSIEASLNALLD